MFRCPGGASTATARCKGTRVSFPFPPCDANFRDPMSLWERTTERHDAPKARRAFEGVAADRKEDLETALAGGAIERKDEPKLETLSEGASGGNEEPKTEAALETGAIEHNEEPKLQALSEAGAIDGNEEPKPEAVLQAGAMEHNEEPKLETLSEAGDTDGNEEPKPEAVLAEAASERNEEPRP